MIDVTANFAMDYKDSYEKLYDQLNNNDKMPLVFTVVQARIELLLYVHGVDRKTIHNEYPISNYYRYQGKEQKLEKSSCLRN